MLLVGRYFMVHDDSRLGYDKSHLLTHDMSVRLYDTSAELVCFEKNTQKHRLVTFINLNTFLQVVQS